MRMGRYTQIVDVSRIAESHAKNRYGRQL